VSTVYPDDTTDWDSAMSIPSAAIYMVGYEYLLARLTWSLAPSSSITDSKPSVLSIPDSAPPAHLTPAPLVAGATARTFSATIISPIEMFRTRLQALPKPNTAPPSYGSTFKDMSTMVRSKGPTVLWRGLGPTLWRDVPFSGIYWAGVEVLKVKLAPQFQGVTLSFVSGALSGTLAALVTQPFDVLKTRRQVFSPSASCSPEALRHRASTWPIAMHVIKTEGWAALFAGVVPRCGKVAPACGLMIACYEGVGRWLGDNE
jgi:solute carrier family 25 protein 39/40